MFGLRLFSFGIWMYVYWLLICSIRFIIWTSQFSFESYLIFIVLILLSSPHTDSIVILLLIHAFAKIFLKNKKRYSPPSSTLPSSSYRLTYDSLIQTCYSHYFLLVSEVHIFSDFRIRIGEKCILPPKKYREKHHFMLNNPKIRRCVW